MTTHCPRRGSFSKLIINLFKWVLRMFEWFKGKKNDSIPSQTLPEPLAVPAQPPVAEEEEGLLDFGSLKLVRAGHGGYDNYETRWLVENVWIEGGTGILAGMPKTGKTWLVIDMAVSIASGLPFLEKFPTRQGPVVIYSPEGPSAELDKRIRQVAARRGLDYKRLPIYCAQADWLYLNQKKDQEALEGVVEKIRPVLLIFDPLMECFDGDENRAADIEPMVRWIDHLARNQSCGVLITHHMSKRDSGSMRGSGVLLSFGDNYMFLERKAERTILNFLSRHGQPADPVLLRLIPRGGNPGYELDEDDGLKQRVLDFLRSQSGPVTQRRIREACKGKTSRYKSVLDELRQEGEIRKRLDKWEYIADADREKNSESQATPQPEGEAESGA